MKVNYTCIGLYFCLLIFTPSTVNSSPSSKFGVPTSRLQLETGNEMIYSWVRTSEFAVVFVILSFDSVIIVLRRMLKQLHFTNGIDDDLPTTDTVD